MGIQWSASWCSELAARSGTVVIFGAAGDLAKRKLYASLSKLHNAGLWDDGVRVLGCARRDYSDVEFRNFAADALGAEADSAFLSRLGFIGGDYRDDKLYEKLAERLKCCPNHDVLFHLAVPPDVYRDIVPKLARHGLLDDHSGRRNVIFEKPFGGNLKEAVALDAMLKNFLREDQIYRIDHYLGKETVQNILITRFANVIFEPIWNNHYIDSVEIHVDETVGVGRRGAFYDRTGAVRDMFQNHLIGLLALVAMELPGGFSADPMRRERLKLIKSIRPFELDERLRKRFIRARYTASDQMPGYLEENGVAPDSRTETFAAGCFYIDNWRWHGVPFFLRSGKCMAERSTAITITFKTIPQSIFSPIRPADIPADTLVLKVQPEEGLALTIQGKQPGPKLCMGQLAMDFDYRKATGVSSVLDAYARLFLDAMAGDRTLFLCSDEIQASWELFTPVLEYWAKHPEFTLYDYKAGTSLDTTQFSRNGATAFR